MKTRKLVIIGIFVLLMIATAVFWVVSFSNLIAENKAEVERTGIERGINYFGFKILVAALTVVFEADVLYDVLYFISDKSKKTKQKTVFNIICAVLCGLYSIILIVDYWDPAFINSTLSMMIDSVGIYIFIITPIVWVALRGFQFLRYLFNLPSKEWVGPENSDNNISKEIDTQ